MLKDKDCRDCKSYVKWIHKDDEGYCEYIVMTNNVDLVCSDYGCEVDSMDVAGDFGCKFWERKTND